MLLWLLTAARISEVIFARSEEYSDGVWTIPADRVKNSRAHRIALGPWGQSLIRTNSEWVFPSTRIDGPRLPCGWYKARPRVLARMTAFAGRPVEKWTPRRNEFICWVEDAKQPATRQRHIDRACEELLEGKRRPCCWAGCIHRTDKSPSQWQQAVLIDKKAKRRS
jgi:integrase